MKRKIISLLGVVMLIVMTLPAITPSPASAADTGWYSPSADAADTGGDGNGFEVNPTRAYADGAPGYAENNNGSGDRHRYWGYNFSSIPADSTINGIEVRLDWWLDSTSGSNNRMEVQLSWDGGSSWTSNKNTSGEPTSETTTILGGPADKWGHDWTAAQINDANFRVRIRCNSSDSGRDFYLDWVAVKVYYTSSVPNPELEESCGLDIVLVMDESTSIDSTEFAQMQAAFVDFVDALSSTPTEFALVDFGTLAYQRSGFTSDYTAITTLINNPRLGGTQYTNWQQGLLLAHNLFPNRVDNPDLIIFASDGNPTAYRNPATTGTDSATMAAALAAAIPEADGIKSDDIRIITIGIGNPSSGDPTEQLNIANLIAISGPVVSPPASISADVDVITTDFDDLAEDLAELATQLCGGTITVHKVIDCDGNLATIGDQSDGEGWTFTANVTAPGSSTPTSDDTDSDGLLNFVIDFCGQGTATVSIVETLDPDIELLGAICTGATNIGSFDGTDSIDGIVIDSNDIVTCTFYNTIDCDDGDSCTIDTCEDGECVHTPIDCDDGDACTTDTCDPVTGCVHTPIDCDDGDACTTDTCDPVTGCVHTPIDCDDGDACTTDTCDPVTGCVHTPIDCDDGDACTTDTCDPVTGCVHTPIDCDDGDACTTDTCDPVTGCVHTPIDCDDGDACTTDTCDPVTGCVHTPIDCDDGDACTTDTCDPVTGCVHTPIDCDDGDACTTDTCDPVTGCVHTPIDCDDGNACTTDTCDPVTGCVHTPIDCDDGDACTTDTCDPVTGCVHTPIDCDDGDACTTDTCDPVTGCVHTPIDCDDGDACTTDTCDPVTGCVHTPIDCDDGDSCTTDTCDPVTGCVHTPIDCDDGDACTTDTCDPVTGCVHTPIDCDDGDACTTDTCDPVTGCVHTPIDCDDGDACTTDTCDPVTGCVHTPIDCDDGDACTTDTCDPVTGCVHTPIDCDDGDACTTDTCDPVTGCVHTPIDCDDGDACTTDTCDPVTGCVHTPIDCDDGDACTTDTCDPVTGCVHTPIDCDDGDACTTDTCDPVTGCVHTPIDCDDENACTIDTCEGGVCVHTPIVCDDGDPCTTDECVDGVCVYTLTNPPHLVVDKSVSPDLTCGEATVTLNITGAGCQAGQRLPVDVLLIIDRSISMNTDGKLTATKQAAKDFIDLLDDSKDRVGLVSYSDSATLNQGLTNDFAAVKTAIDGLSTSGYTNIGAAINTANTELTTNGRSSSEAVRVEILLTDGLPNRPSGMGGNFNEASAEYARGFAQAASANNITLYTIGLGSSNDPSTGISQYFLDDLPASGHTYNPGDPAGNNYAHDGLAYIGGGHYYPTPTSADLVFMFEQISQEITNIAGTDVVVTEVLPSGVNYADSAVPTEPYEISPDGQTLTWNLGSISINETITITFDVTFDNAGEQLVDVHPDTRVDYTDYQGTPASEVFPMTYVRVLQPVADAGPDVTINSGESTGLNGFASYIDGGCGDVGGNIEYQWSIEGGAVIQSWSTDPTVTVSPTVTTTYTLEVRCSALPDCTDSDDVVVTVTTECEAPVAAFSGTPRSGCAPLTVAFTDTSTGNPTSWSWTFTGGSPSSHTGQTPPSVTYNNPGTYTVSLTVYNDCGPDTETRTGYITVGGPPAANFSGTPRSGCAPLTVDFTDQSTGNPTSWSWTFTGGSPSSATGKGPHEVTYNSPGTYTVSLTVYNDCGSDPETKTNYITVEECVCQYDLTVTSDGCCYITVGALGTVDPGTTETFGVACGTDVTLNAQETECCNFVNWTGDVPGGSSSTNPITIHVDSDKNVTGHCTGVPAPTADFSGTPRSGCVSLTVAFTDLSTGNPTSWSWTFGDGGISNLQNPSHTYTSAGTYTVSLTVYNDCGSDNETKPNYIEAIVCGGGGGGGGGGGCPAPNYLTVDWDGNITSERLYSNDRLAVNLLGPSSDGRHSLLLEQGTLAPTVGKKIYYLIVIRELADEDIPPLAENTVAIVAFNVTPAGAVFDRDIFLTLGLNQLQLPANALNATMAYYDDVNGVWVPLEYEAGGPNGVAELTLSAPINHFSIFGVLAELAPTPTQPAHFKGSGLSIVPSVEKTTFVTKTGESVTITFNLANDGGQEGPYTVALKLNGQTVDTRTVTLGAGQSQPVSFTRSGLDYGQYEVEVAGLSGEFTASRTITWWLIIVIIAAIGLIIWGVAWSRRRRKAHQAA